MADSHRNFAYSTVATAPSPASSGTSLVVAASDGAKFPTVPFNATVWAAGAQPSTTNAEIVRVTAIATDTLTITRTQEGSSARSILVGDQIAATVTAKTLTDVETAFPLLAPPTAAQNTIQPTADIVPLTIKGKAGQTAHVLDITNSTGTSFLAIDAGGNVGIGTTTPTYLLELDTKTNATGGVRIGGSYSYVNILGNSGVDVRIDAANWDLTLQTSGVDRLRILNSGLIGIGTSAPSGILDLTSTTAAFLPPRMTTTQKNAIIPAAGMLVYDTTLVKLSVYTGSAWETVTSV